MLIGLNSLAAEMWIFMLSRTKKDIAGNGSMDKLWNTNSTIYGSTPTAMVPLWRLKCFVEYY